MSTFETQQALENDYIMHTFARKGVCLVEGQGMQLRDDAGNAYLDFIAGIGVCSLGHCHPAVVDAIVEQAQRLMHVSNYYYIEQRGELAQQMSDLLNAEVPESERTPWQSFFTNSGAESNECAMKLARLWSKTHSHGGNIIVTMERSFHGRTMETLAATAQPAKQEAFQPLPEGFVHVPLNDTDALQAVFDANPQGICAVMMEPIQGESGVHPSTKEYIQAAWRIAHENGALLILDEVQTGIYRTGKPFAFQHFDVVPDIVSIAKGIGDGFPMGICAALAPIAAAFQPGDHGTTFGGSCLAVAAAKATLDALEQQGIAENAEQVGAYLRERLAALPGVVEVRGMGLMNACDLVESVEAPKVVEAGLRCGLLLNATGPHTLRFLPPLVCAREDVDALAEKLPDLMG